MLEQILLGLAGLALKEEDYLLVAKVSSLVNRVVENVCVFCKVMVLILKVLFLLFLLLVCQVLKLLLLIGDLLLHPQLLLLGT